MSEVDGTTKRAIRTFLVAYWESRGANPVRVRITQNGGVAYFKEPVEVLPGVRVRKMFKSFRAIEEIQEKG